MNFLPINTLAAHRTNWLRDKADAPFFSLGRGPDGLLCRGLENCLLGTPIAPAEGEGSEGLFAGWTYAEGRLDAFTDPLGFFSLFYCVDGDRAMVSPSILQLLANGAAPEPDQRALGVFYRLGLFVNDDTPFRHIKVLPPGGRLVWQDGRFSVSGAAFVPKEQPISRDAAVDGIIELTRESLHNIRAAWPGDMVLPLSGGRDSRHILLELHHQGAPPERCMTFQHAAGRHLSADSQAARAICRELGVAHEVLGPLRTRPHDIIRTLVLTSLCSDEHKQMLPLHDHLRGISGAALDGIAGDILTNPDDDAEGHFCRAQNGDFEGIARVMMHGHSRALSRNGRRLNIGEILDPGGEERTLDYLAQTIAGFAEAADPYQAFWFWNRTRREIGFVTSALFATAPAVFCPFLDLRFVSFCLSLPYSVTRDQQLHNDALARAYPETATVPYDDAFAGPTPSGPRLRHIQARMKTAVAGVRLINTLSRDRGAKHVRDYLCGSPVLNRAHAEVLQFYDLALHTVQTGGAADLMAMAGRFAQAAPTGLVTSRWQP
ncbi:MAG: hypothetical protein R3D84_18195 [Paracoccaceae bacterium]